MHFVAVIIIKFLITVDCLLDSPHYIPTCCVTAFTIPVPATAYELFTTVELSAIPKKVNLKTKNS